MKHLQTLGCVILGVALLALTGCGATTPAAPTSAPPSAVPTSAPATAAPPTSAPPANTPTPPAAASPTAAGTQAPTPAPTATILPVVAADTTQVTVTRVEIPPIKGKTASIDILDIDQAAHLLYVTDRTDNGLDVFDIASPTAKYLRTIDMGSGPNGVTVAKNVNKVFAGLNNSNVAIVDVDPASSTLNTVLARLNTGGKNRADEMDYDPKEKKLYVANSNDQFVTVIDAVKNTIVKKIDLPGGGLEQPRYNPADGMMYLTGSDDNLVYQFDPATDTLVKKVDVVDPCNPNGLAINPATGQAILGCSNRKDQHTALWDLKAGKLVTRFTQVGAGDAAIYNAKADRFFFAASNFYRGAMIGLFGGSPVKFITNLPTANYSGSHGVAYDETNKVIYTQDQLAGEGALFSLPLPSTP
jgi:YVTN family beta-propeller protein